MSDPLSVQAAALAAVDRLIDLARAADPGPWEVGPTFGARDNRVYVRQEGDLIDSVGTCVIAGQVANMTRFRENARHIAANHPEAIRAQLEGRRRILQRRGPVLCSQCPESRQHYVDALFASINWPSEDWRDAAAGLPLEGADHD